MFGRSLPPSESYLSLYTCKYSKQKMFCVMFTFYYTRNSTVVTFESSGSLSVWFQCAFYMEDILRSVLNQQKSTSERKSFCNYPLSQSFVKCFWAWDIQGKEKSWRVNHRASCWEVCKNHYPKCSGVKQSPLYYPHWLCGSGIQMEHRQDAFSASR